MGWETNPCGLLCGWYLWKRDDDSFFDRVSPAILKLASVFKEKGSNIFFEPSSRGGNVKMFNKCVEVSDIVKFSDQRIKDAHQFDDLKDKLFIQTQGANGLSFRLNSEWIHLEPFMNDNVVDTAGAGDWTAAALPLKRPSGFRSPQQNSGRHAAHRLT